MSYRAGLTYIRSSLDFVDLRRSLPASHEYVLVIQFVLFTFLRYCWPRKRAASMTFSKIDILAPERRNIEVKPTVPSRTLVVAADGPSGNESLKLKAVR